jgi:ABC-type multidrug transport system fused ATPase/permease subunit
MTSQPKLAFWRKIWNVLTPRERRWAGVEFVLSLIGMFLETLGIGMVIPTVMLLTLDDPAARYPVLRPVLEFFGNPSQEQLVVGGMVTLGLVYMIKSVYLGFLVWSQNRFATTVRVRLSEQLFTAYLRQPYAFHLQRNSAYLIRNALAETAQLVQGGLRAVMTLTSEFALLIGVGALLLIVEPLGALAVVAVVGSASLLFHRYTRERVTRWGVQRRDSDGLRLLHMRQGLASVKEIKLLGREAVFLERYRHHNRLSAKAGELQTTIAQFPRLGLELLAVLGLVVLVLAMLAQGRDLGSVLPILGVFGAAAFRLLPSVNKILGALHQIRFSIPVVDALYPELQLSAPPIPRRASGAAYQFKSDIRLTDIEFTYPAAPRPALVGVTLEIRKGESVGLIGPSGSGKTTVVDVLLGMLVPTHGRVSVDGEDIHKNLRRWQDQIGYVPQSIYLTDDTLRRNVAYGIADEEIDDAAVDRAIRAAQLQEFVASLPQGMETKVGERGVRLSGGQRQRIGIARALYHDPAVLVLDEATSALDTATEREVMQAVSALHGTKTIIIIAHRLTTVENCDRLYRLAEGRVAEEGTPQDILAPESDLTPAAVPQARA